MARARAIAAAHARTGTDVSVLVPFLLRPWWLLALLPLLFLLPWLARRRTLADPWRTIVDPALLPHLRGAQDERSPRWPLRLLATAWILAVLALAGPSWTRSPTPMHRPGGALVVLLDLSLSMYANDVGPNRIAVARREIQDLARQWDGGRIALIAYAGDAHVVTPLTDDARTLTNLLAALEPAIMPLPGSHLGDALAQARRLLQDGGETRGMVVVVTDEVTNAADLTAFEDPRFPISVLGIGTEAGAPIPLDFTGQSGRFLTDPQGIAILPKLDPERLAQVARLGGGAYASARPDDSDTRALLDDAPTGDTRATRTRGAARLAWQDQGHWLVLLLLPLCAWAFRRGVVIAVCWLSAAFMLLPAVPASASPLDAVGEAWTNLWWRRDQQAAEALDTGRPDEAARLFTDPRGRATALYRSGRYAEAAKLFRQDPSATGAYNLGNALARSGRIDDAIRAYDRALRLAPGHADATHNRNLLLGQRAQADGSDEPNDGSSRRRGDARGAKPRDDGTASDGATEQGRQGTGERGRAGQGGDAERQAAAAAARAQAGQAPRGGQQAPSTAEQRRATEQWLRRVPDQPGRLLQNKFETESALRAQRGERPPPGERVW